MIEKPYFAHETACIDEPVEIGKGTYIWHFSHVMKGAKIGSYCNLGQNVFVASGVVMGNRVKIQNNVSLYAGLTIEDDVFLGPSCVFTNISNPRSQIDRRTLYESTRLRKGCTIGANATVICGIEVGQYAFIAAGATVVKDVPDYALMMGMPARQVGWMSRHGHRLVSPAENGIMVCPESGYRYQLTEGNLRCLDLEEELPLPAKQLTGTIIYREVKKQMNHTEQKMEVPLLAPTRDVKILSKELSDAFQRVIESGMYILGSEVTTFEKMCADYLNIRHAVAVSSGTDALLLALMVLDIKPGDEVICPTYTFFSTAGVIWRLGATPVFVDIDPDTYNCSIGDIERKITNKTKAIIPVHLFGQCAEMAPILDLARSRNIAVVEDVAQSMGADYYAEKAGTMGDYGCFSFFPSKNMGGFGDSGLLVTNNDDLAEKARIFRGHGAKPKYYHHYVGGNFRMDPLQAALLQVKFGYLDTYIQQRRTHAARYAQFLGRLPSVQLPVVSSHTEHTYNQYIIRLEDQEQRRQLRDYLAQHGVATAIYYPLPLHLQPCFESLEYQVGQLPEAELASKTTLAIPIFPELSTNEQQYVVEHIVSFFS